MTLFAMVLIGSAAVAQALPVKTYREIKAWKGDRVTVVASAPGEAFTLVSAHKEAQRPWADALFERNTAEGKTLVRHAYDCANATYRWMGEARRFRDLSLSITSMDQMRDRRLEPGTVEYQLARYVCAL
ncbi:hypothetical protein [Algicella marina]|uniref:Uncharacterized protein n=1 Tax=Algicella marina TaxID=2683284 RepID=A0A6P1SZI8_9RHOB|nr:hypothetical protein [Algicella marina]QHQ34626.1 hypothetical protein GO499_05180 [Algicella marina]